MKNKRPPCAGPSDPRRPAAAARGRGRPPAERGERAGTAQPGGRRPAGEASKILGNGGGPAAGRSPPVWLLGNDYPAADKSIDWRGSIPSLNDPDILIVDITTLTEDTTYQIGRYMLGHIQKSIRDKFFYGGSTIVVIMSAMVWAPPPDAATRGPIFSFDGSLDPYAYSNYHVLPTVPEIVQAGRGRRILPDAGHNFKAYLDAVSHFNFSIEGHDLTICLSYGGPRFYLERVDGQSIMDNSGHYLGFTLVVTEAGGGMRTRRVENTGNLVFLPPYTEPAADAIGKILSACRKALPPCRPASGTAAGSASTLGIQPGGHVPPQKMAPESTVAENGPTANLPPPRPVAGTGRGGAAGSGTAPSGGVGSPPASTGGGTDAFLSYHHEAKDSAAKPLVEGLEERGVTVWWDSTAMRIRDELSLKIKEGLDGARCGVVIVSRGYLDSDWGKTELGAMFGKGLPIFPILHGATAEEAQKRLPVLLGRLMRVWDVSPESIMDEIAGAIKEGRGGLGGPKAPAPDGLPPQGRCAPPSASPARAPAKPHPAGAAPGTPPPLGRHTLGIERLLADRNILSVEAGDFAQNRHFRHLLGPLPNYNGAKKPAVLFTAVPHRLGSYDTVTTAQFSEWVGSIRDLEVEKNSIHIRGFEQTIDAESLTVTERHPYEAQGSDVKSYREFHVTGLFEYGTSCRYLRLNDRGDLSLVLCHMIGDFWGFLLHSRPFYQKLGQDGPFAVILSVKNSSSLALGNYGDEATDPRWGMKRRHTHLPADVRTASLHIRLACDLGPAGEMTDSGMALAAKDMARRVCSAYGQDIPLCYDESGQFSWKLWEMVSR